MSFLGCVGFFARAFGLTSSCVRAWEFCECVRTDEFVRTRLGFCACVRTDEFVRTCGFLALAGLGVLENLVFWIL